MKVKAVDILLGIFLIACCSSFVRMFLETTLTLKVGSFAKSVWLVIKACFIRGDHEYRLKKDYIAASTQRDLINMNQSQSINNSEYFFN